MDIKGTCIQLLPMQSGQSAKGTWKKLEFVIETADQYPKKICFTLFGDKVDNNPVAEGDQLNVFFDVESREFNGKWYTNLNAWKVERMGAGQSNAGNSAASAPAPVDFNTPDNGDGDLPF